MSDVSLKPGHRASHADFGEAVIAAIGSDGYLRVFFRSGERRVNSAAIKPARSRAERILDGVEGGEDRLRRAWLHVEAHALPLMENAAVLRESLAVQPARIVKYPSKMTERQWEVLCLLAQGKTNGEISQALVISERTVQRHISNIYDKIGARNRSEATAFAISQLHA